MMNLQNQINEFLFKGTVHKSKMGYEIMKYKLLITLHFFHSCSKWTED